MLYSLVFMEDFFSEKHEHVLQSAVSPIKGIHKSVSLGHGECDTLGKIKKKTKWFSTVHINSKATLYLFLIPPPQGKEGA